MAQTAKIISPDKKVLLPNMNAGCLMADMINYEQMLEFKKRNPDIPVVCYINSTAEVKSLCDICCTSSNAVEIVRSLNAPKVLFVPDANLGKYVESQVSGTEVITYPGCCPVHDNVTVENILDVRKKYPSAKILIHPECRPEVSSLGDYIGSTSGIIDYVKNSSESQFVIVTEKGVADRLKRDNPDKEHATPVAKKAPETDPRDAEIERLRKENEIARLKAELERVKREKESMEKAKPAPKNEDADIDELDKLLESSGVYGGQKKSDPLPDVLNIDIGGGDWSIPLE